MGKLKGARKPPRNETVETDVLSLMSEAVALVRRADKPVVEVLYQKDNNRVNVWFVNALGSVIVSAFNATRFASDAGNLQCLLPGMHFPGFNQPSWYVKTCGSFFCLHVEQIFAPFYNCCYKGSTTWFVVERRSMGRLYAYLEMRAAAWYGVQRELTAAERASCKFSKKEGGEAVH